MDRKDRAELIDLEEENKYALKPLKLAQNSILGRFKVKPVANTDHAKNSALDAEISQL